MTPVETDEKIYGRKMAILSEILAKPDSCELFRKLMREAWYLSDIGENPESAHALQLSLTAIHKNAGCTSCVNVIR